MWIRTLKEVKSSEHTAIPRKISLMKGKYLILEIKGNLSQLVHVLLS